MSTEHISKYRKKPVVVEATCFTTNNEAGSPTMDRIVNWINQGRSEVGAWHNGTDIYIRTLEGEMRAEVKDWIIRGVKGEFYPIKPDIFSATYDLAYARSNQPPAVVTEEVVEAAAKAMWEGDGEWQRYERCYAWNPESEDCIYAMKQARAALTAAFPEFPTPTVPAGELEEAMGKAAEMMNRVRHETGICPICSHRQAGGR